MESLGDAMGIVELVIWQLAGFVLFRGRGNSFAEAISYAMVTTMMVASFLFQFFFVIGLPGLSPGAEAILTVLSVVIIHRSRGFLVESVGIIGFFFRSHPAAFSFLCLGSICLLVQALGFSPGPIHSESLDAIRAIQARGSFFTAGAADAGAPLRPVNILILPHMFLRFSPDTCPGLFGFMAHVGIGAATYALARRYAWPPTAFTVTLVVLSLPRFVLLASSPGFEIVQACVAVFCILAVYRLVERPNPGDLILLILGAMFGITGTGMCLTFPIIVALLSCVILFRRHGAGIWRHVIVSNRWLILISFAPAVLFSQCWVFGYNLYHHGGWLGSPETMGFIFNAGGPKGSLANLLCYFLESAHFTPPIDRLWDWISGAGVIETLQGLHDRFILPLLGGGGAAEPFRISWSPSEGRVWFGPLGFILAPLGVLYASLRGPRRLKAVALALLAYLYVVALVPAWLPENVRYFSILYACGGFTAAFLLPPWRIPRKGKRTLQCLGLLLLFHACLFHPFKPLIPPDLLHSVLSSLSQLLGV
ncbi:MAG: hypothetical protein GY859_19245 [Desulfobacterales bacterium]|nr:hypothetical protein [Desulfobacterales bacterium]